MTEPLLCPEGKYCGSNTITPADCPLGKFSDLKGLKTIDDCQVGAYGKYYNELGMSANTAGINCDALYKCYHDDVLTSAGISDATPEACVEGEICPSGTAVP